MRLRYSLVALTFLVTGLCVGLGFLGFQVQNVRKQQQVVYEIKRHGGNVLYSDLGRPTMVGRALSPLTGTTSTDVIAVVFNDSPSAEDEALKNLYRMAQLQGLHLRSTRVTDKSVDHIVKVTSLRKLDVSFTEISDAGLAKLVKELPELQLLYTSSSAISVESVAALQKSSSLRYLLVHEAIDKTLARKLKQGMHAECEVHVSVPKE